VPDDVQIVKDIAIVRRLSRIVAAGGVLSEKTSRALASLRNKYPDFEPSPGDQDDFDVYTSGGFRGPRGDPDKLKDVPTDKLLETALTIEAQEQWDQGDLWSILCRSEPARAFAAIETAANSGQWPARAWRPFLESVADTKDSATSLKVLGLIVHAPPDLLAEAVFHIGSWMYRQRAMLVQGSAEDGAAFLEFWDKFADVVYANPSLESLQRERKGDLMTAAINEPGGLLAATILDILISRKPAQDSGFPRDLKARATRSVSGATQSNLLARIIFTERLSFIDSIDHDWASQNLFQYLDSNSSEARTLWRARAYDGHPGLPRMFNALKPSLLKVLARSDLAHNEGQSLVAQLLRAYIWHKPGENDGYQIERGEVRNAIANASRETRRSTAWLFMNWLRAKEDNEDSPDKRWNEWVGETFRAVWPIDANLRDEQTSQQLVWMALSCDVCFPQAVSYVENLIVPMDIYRISITFNFDKTGRELLRKYPKAYLRLLNVAIDPRTRRIPDDLGDVLAELEAADASIVQEDAFRRLTGTWKMRQAAG